MNEELRKCSSTFIKEKKSNIAARSPRTSSNSQEPGKNFQSKKSMAMKLHISPGESSLSVFPLPKMSSHFSLAVIKFHPLWSLWCSLFLQVKLFSPFLILVVSQDEVKREQYMDLTYCFQHKDFT